MTFEGEGTPPIAKPRRRRIRRIAAVTVPTGAALGAGAVIATGAIPGSDGTVRFCYDTAEGRGVARIVDEASACEQGEAQIKVAQTGPQGPTGPVGPAGPAGPPGPAGGGGLAIPAYPVAASDFLLEIDGIKGESSDSKHKDAIEIESFSWGATRKGASAVRGGGAGAGKVSFQDFHFTKAIDRSSPLLLRAAATGQHIKKAVLFVRKAGKEQQEYLVIKLTDILVSSYQTSPQAPGSGQGPVEDVKLDFAKVEYEYRPINPDGSLGAPVKAGYDLKANKKV